MLRTTRVRFVSSMVFAALLFASTAQAQDSVRALFSPFEDLRSTAIAELQKAQRKVLVAQYNIRDELFVDTLVALQARGVEVRIAIDAKNARQPWNVVDELMVARGLQVTQVVHSGNDYGIMHHKFTVIDDQVVMTGSFNWNETARLVNNENMLVIQSRQIAAEYSREFQELLKAVPNNAGSPSGLTASAPIRVLFCPEDRPSRELARLVDAARRSVRVAVFTCYDTDTQRALERAARRGVQVTLVTEAKQATNSQVDEAIARAGAHVVIAANTSSAHSAMHHKYMVIDEEIVATGACNWTYTAFNRSEEDVIILRDRALAEAYVADFEDLLLWYDASFDEALATTRRSTVDFNFVGECASTEWGEELRVVGEHPSLGSWKVENAPSLGTTDSVFPRWSGHVSLPAGARVEYKLVRYNPTTKTVVWESGFNRSLTTSPTGRRQSRFEVFRE